MEIDADAEMEWGRRDRLLGSLNRMVEAGRLTEREAEGLRTATDASEFNHAVREIRVRHAGLKLDAAVADGSLTRADADGLVDRLRDGDHGGAIPARFRALRAHGRHRG